MAISFEFQSRFQELVDEMTDIKKSAIPGKIGIGYDIFSKSLNYGIVPKTKVLVRIADYFNISLEYLLGMTKDEYFTKAKRPISFPERLEQLCRETGLTIYQISQETHIDRSNFSFWRRGKYLPSLEHLALLAEYFESSFDYILGRSDDK